TNHLGTVHAIAMCNAAELAAGMMTNVSIPAGARWIPKGMTVEYLAKAKTDLTAVASGEGVDWSSDGDKVVPVVVTDTEGKTVFTAQITMNVKLGWTCCFGFPGRPEWNPKPAEALPPSSTAALPRSPRRTGSPNDVPGLSM